MGQISGQDMPVEIIGKIMVTEENEEAKKPEREGRQTK